MLTPPPLTPPPRQCAAVVGAIETDVPLPQPNDWVSKQREGKYWAVTQALKELEVNQSRTFHVDDRQTLKEVRSLVFSSGRHWQRHFVTRFDADRNLRVWRDK
jgi:hypothetical protein